MGASAFGSVNIEKTVKFLGDSLGVPSDLIQQQIIPENLKLTEEIDAL